MAIVLTINGLSLYHLYRSTRSLLTDELRERVLAIATAAASQVDGDMHSTLKVKEDESSEAYTRLSDTLRKVRDANRRPATYVRFIYTLTPSPADPKVLQFVLDPEEITMYQSHVADPYVNYTGQTIQVGPAAYADKEFSTDQWGTWLSAYAPVKNSAGEVVAMLGVDIAAEQVEAALVPLEIAALLSVAIGIVLAITGGLGMAAKVSQPLLSLRGTLARIGAGDLHAKAEIRTRDEFGEMAEGVNRMAAGLREREAVKGAFARYVSNQVLESILKSGDLPHVHGDRRKVTILFSDIRSFTTIAERMRPEDVVGFLNEYFASMVDVTFKYHGTLDKFMGDGLMVVFGAPIEDANQEENAVRAAIEMQLAVRRISQRWELEGRGPLQIGIGINTGSAIVGNIGSEDRMEYTAIGDAVNLASRLESSTKDVGAEILISETTRNAVQDKFDMKETGSFYVKGRTEKVMTYSVNVPESAEGHAPQAPLLG